ncbi:MAG: TIGR02281 family clan AA aspartic protease [Vampirovibrionales bacterium]|nr:TIGR02281 family clan AA aspartic protease [Vampirovibrionales bacterium]
MRILVTIIKRVNWPVKGVLSLVLFGLLMACSTLALKLPAGFSNHVSGYFPAIHDDVSYTQMALSAWEDLYLKGVREYRRGEYAKSADLMQQVLASRPGTANAHYYLAVCLDLLNKKAEALGHYQAVVISNAQSDIRTYAQSRLLVIRHSLNKNNGDNKIMLSSTSPLVEDALLSNATRKIQNRIVRLKSNRNALMVEAVLVNAANGKQVRGTFILDTGATYTSISRELAQGLGLDTTNGEKVHITTANGRIDVPKVVIDHLRIDGVEAEQVQATVIDVRPDSTFSGLLGLSFIRQFKMTIDPTQNQLVFEPR